MADDDWESKNFEEEIAPKTAVPVKVSDKWDGEDEEEPIKDNWDDEDEEKAVSSSSASAAKPKIKLRNKIAEKERDEIQKLEKSRLASMTPEERAAEKLRQQKLMEEAELQMLKTDFGTSDVDMADPMTKDDFDALRKKIIADLRKFEKRAPFEDFLEDFIQDLCLSLSTKRLRKVSTTVQALYFEKNKAEKATATAKTKGKPGKAKIIVETDATKVDVGYNELEDYDDFM